MTHDAAVRAVVKLVPEIEKRGAEIVLREHATREDLPPAQLEKLAQVFNTLRTVSHIDKASDRGSSVNLVDVPALVIGYALDMGHEKKALAPISHQTHAPTQVDLMAAMRAEIAGPKFVRVKKASAAVAAKKVAAADVRDAALEIAVDARWEMSKLARIILSGVPVVDDCYDISGIERDAIHARGIDLTKKACDWLAKAAYRSQLIRHDYNAPLVKQAFAVGSQLSGALIELVEACSTHQLMEKLAAHQASAFDISDEEEAAAATASRTHADVAAELTPEELLELADSMRQDGIEIEPEVNEAEPAARSASPAPTADGGGGSNSTHRSAPQSTDARKDTKPGNKSPGSVWDAVTSPIRAANDALITTSSKAKELLNSITSKERTNKAQRNTDISVEDVRRAINVRRMIATDDVLREADPREVIEIYNSVARINPEIAHNIPAMKLLLREAVSYEGLTLDAQKQLTDIRKGTGESEAKEYDNDKRRYTAGGAIQIGGPSRKA